MIIVMDMQSGEQVVLSSVATENVQPALERPGFVCPALQTYPVPEEKRLAMPALIAQVFCKER